MSVVVEMAEEDDVDRDFVFDEVGDDSLGRRIDFGRHDCQRVILVEFLGRRRAEAFGECLLERLTLIEETLEDVEHFGIPRVFTHEP